MLLTAYMIASLPEYTLSVKRGAIKNLNGYERLTFDTAVNIVNALDNILIKDIEKAIYTISEALEDQDREEIAKTQVFIKKRRN